MIEELNERDRSNSEHDGIRATRNGGNILTEVNDIETQNEEMKKDTTKLDVIPPKKRKNFRKTL